MNVPFIDFSEQYQKIKDEIDVGLKQVFEKGNFILGEEEKRFEENFAKFCEVDYAVGVGSGTDALYLALSAIGVGPGDEVILPTHTFIATALCISYTGATPVLVDIEDDTYNMDPACLKKVITERTKAILPVHIYGQTPDMSAINKIAKEHNIMVVEDACQAHGATFQNHRTGSLGDIGCFSFYPTKSLGAFGDGGIVVTKNREVYDKINMLRDYGRKDRYQHQMKGYNSRLDTVQAVILDAKLKYLNEWNQMRNAHAAKYFDQLKDVSSIITPKVMPDRTHVFQTFAVISDHRDQLLESLKSKGIGALIHYPIPIHLQEAYADLGHQKGDFPVAERVADSVMSIPMFPHMTQEQISYVCEALKDPVRV